MNFAALISRRLFCATSSSALVLAAGYESASAAANVVPGDRMGFPDDPREDATAVLQAKIAEAKTAGGGVVKLPAGELHFYSPNAINRFLHISNNDDVENSIIALIEDAKNITIRGHDTKLIFHGPVTPFVILNSKNVRLEGISIDWEKTFHMEANITARDESGEWLEFEVAEGFDFDVRDGRLIMVMEEREHVGSKRVMEFDKERRETTYMAGVARLSIGTNEKTPIANLAERIGERQVRITATQRKITPIMDVGNRLCFMPFDRICPGVFAEDATGLVFENMTIHHSGCMGILAQTCHDIRMDGLNVVPSGDRYISTCVDATHFVNCSGLITMQNGDFSNHIDDALNVHGIYARVTGVAGTRTLKADFPHYQQLGVKNFRKGERVSLGDKDSVLTYLEARVADVTYDSPSEITVTLDTDLPENVQPGDVLDNLDRHADLFVHGNSIGQNRARGILISTAGQVLVEQNTFHTPGSAIRISGGVDHWYESGPVSQVLIQHNVFDHCKYGPGGRSVLDIVAIDSEESTSQEPYHGTIIVSENEFRTEHGDLISAYRIGDLRFERNTIIVEPYQRADAQTDTPIELLAVASHSVKNNVVRGYEWPDLVVIGEAGDPKPR